MAEETIHDSLAFLRDLERRVVDLEQAVNHLLPPPKEKPEPKGKK